MHCSDKGRKAKKLPVSLTLRHHWLPKSAVAESLRLRDLCRGIVAVSASGTAWQQRGATAAGLRSQKIQRLAGSSGARPNRSSKQTQRRSRLTDAGISALLMTSTLPSFDTLLHPCLSNASCWNSATDSHYDLRQVPQPPRAPDRADSLPSRAGVLHQVELAARSGSWLWQCVVKTQQDQVGRGFLLAGSDDLVSAVPCT